MFHSANFYRSLPTPVHLCGPAVHTALPVMSTANPKPFKRLFQDMRMKFPQVPDPRSLQMSRWHIRVTARRGCKGLASASDAPIIRSLRLKGELISG